MPVSPALAENLAQTVVGYYAEAERLMLARMARRLAKGIDGPGWADAKLAQVQAYRAETAGLLEALRKRAETGIGSAITDAYDRGGLTAVAELHKLGVVEPLAGLRAVDALVSESVSAVTATHPHILRTTVDTYRAVVADSSQQVLLGTQTMRQAVQASLDDFAAKGIAGFTDRAGRAWTMESYTEMAMRTGCGHAAVQGHEDRLTANGLDLVIISDAPKECPLCRPHEGKVYSLSGTDEKYPPIAQARAEGLYHPGCRHSESAYQPGITPEFPKTEDPDGYEATVKLRYLERKVRESKRMEAAAMDPAALAKATRRKLDYQAKIRSHVASTPAKRVPWRESFGVSKKQLA